MKNRKENKAEGKQQQKGRKTLQHKMQIIGNWPWQSRVTLLFQELV